MKKQLAIFAEKLYGGGVEKILQVICRNFNYEKYDITLYSSRPEEMPDGTYPEHISHKYYFKSCDKSKGALPYLWGLICNKIKLLIYYHSSPKVFYRLFIRQRYDVGIAFIEGYATRIVSGAPDDMKKIAWVHIELGTFHWTDVAYRSRNEEMSCYKKLNQIVCVSKIVKNQADLLFHRPEITSVIHNPIEIDHIIRQAGKDLPIVYQKKSDIIRFVSLGTLNKRKSYDRLFVAANKLIKEGFEFEILVLGKGEEESSLQEYIQNNNLGEIIKLVGYVDNPYPYVKSCDVYVCSSTAEGYNTAVSEAIILGKAIISTEVSGTREQLGENSEYGIIAENTIEGIYNAMKQMLKEGNITYYKNQSKTRLHLFNMKEQMSKIYNLIDA